MIQLDLRSRLPIYEQLVEKIKELIVKGILQSDEQLPSVRTLANELTINPNTIQKAYRELEREGYIYSVKGRGSFVSCNLDVIDNEKKKTLKEEIKRNITEAIFLGIKKAEVVEIVEDAYKK